MTIIADDMAANKPCDSTARPDGDAATLQKSASKKGDDRHFDPYDYGQADGISRWGAIAHIIRATVGSGILVMPYAMKTLGYVTGTALLLAVSVVYFHTCNVLVSTEYRLCKLLAVERCTFIGLANVVFERAPYPLNKLRLPFQILMYVFYILPISNTAILIVMATSVQHLAGYWGTQLHVTVVVTALVIPLTVCCMFNRLLKILVPYSALTNLLALIMAAVLVGCAIAFRDDAFTAQPFGPLEAVPQGAAMFAQTICCIGIIIPVKNDMRQPRQMAGVTGAVNVSGVTLTLFYTSFGVLSYLFYGERVTDNVLANLAAHNVVSLVVHVLYTSEMLVAYMLAFYVYFQNIWSASLQIRFGGSPHKSLIEYGLRLAIVAVAYGMAVGVPNLGLISTIAGTLSIVIEIALPSLLELLFELALDVKSRWIIFKNLCIIGFSAALFAMSVKSFVVEIILLYSS